MANQVFLEAGLIQSKVGGRVERDWVGGRETQEGRDMGTYVYV